MRTGLRQCRSKQLVTSHAAFGYLAAALRLPAARHHRHLARRRAERVAALKAVADLVRSSGVTTIYQETLVEPHFAQTVAGSTGAKVATLDPLEGITTASVGTRLLRGHAQQPRGAARRSGLLMRSARLVPPEPDTSDAVVTLRGAAFGYGDRAVLTDVDLHDPQRRDRGDDHRATASPP